MRSELLSRAGELDDEIMINRIESSIFFPVISRLCYLSIAAFPMDTIHIMRDTSNSHPSTAQLALTLLFDLQRV